jgi:uncharacterized protein (TIGR03089 family)
MTYWSNLQRTVKDRGPAPLVTWLGELGRIELSAVTFANAVSKAGNFIIDGLELDEDSSIAVELGNHWQSPVWLGAALATGIPLKQDADILFSHADRANTWSASKDSLVVISQDPFGMPSKDVPEGFVNGSAEVRTFGDYFAPSWTNELDVLVAQESFTWDALVGHARALQIANSITDGTCIAISGTGDLVSRVVFTVVLPVIAGLSVVLIDQPSADMDAIKKQEKIDQIITFA